MAPSPTEQQPCRHQVIFKLDRNLSRHLEDATQQTIFLGQSLDFSRGKCPRSVRDQSRRYHLSDSGCPDQRPLLESMTLVRSQLGTFQQIREQYAP